MSDEGEIAPNSNPVSLTSLKLRSHYPEINKFKFFTITLIEIIIYPPKPIFCLLLSSPLRL